MLPATLKFVMFLKGIDTILSGYNGNPFEVSVIPSPNIKAPELFKLGVIKILPWALLYFVSVIKDVKPAEDKV